MIEIETELQMAELHWKNRRWDNAFECYLRVLELGYERVPQPARAHWTC
jgi:hypothetical protein